VSCGHLGMFTISRKSSESSEMSEMSEMSEKTNTQLVADLMNDSRYGPLMQAFVIEAIAQYAEAVKAKPIQENGLVNPVAWRVCADAALVAIDAHTANTRPPELLT